MAGLLQQLDASWILTLSLSSLLILFLFLKRSKSRDLMKPKLPPAPPKLPIIGNMHQLGSLPHRSLAELAKKHGPLMLLRMGRIPTLIVSSREMAQQIMKTNDVDFASRPAVAPARKILYGIKDLVFAPYGEYWRQVRKICVMEMLSNKRVQSFGLVREQEVSCLVRTIHDSKGSVLDLTELFVSLTNNVVCRSALGKKYFGKGGKFYKSSFCEMLSETVELMGGFNFRDFYPLLGWLDFVIGTDWRQRRNFRAWDGFLDTVIKDHLDPNRDHKEYKDFVDVLLHVQRNSKLDVPFTMDNIKALILDMIGAGTETTSTTLVWIMAELIKHPQVMKKAQTEIREAVGSKSKVEECDLLKMSYIKSIVIETLRLHPPNALMVPRECVRTTIVQGYTIPAKSMVHINAWAIGRDPSSWERGEEFLPERHLNSEIDFKGQDFTMIPFGGGRRGCPGISFAVPVLELALVNLLHQFNWELPNGEKMQDLDMSETFGFTVQKKSPLLLVATPHFP